MRDTCNILRKLTQQHTLKSARLKRPIQIKRASASLVELDNFMIFHQRHARSALKGLNSMNKLTSAILNGKSQKTIAQLILPFGMEQIA